MNTTVTGVNEKFAAERATQLADARDARGQFQARLDAGTLIPLGEGRYRINDPGSLDHGEIWIQRGELVLPEHHLDMSRGSAALYTTAPAWHQLGNVVPGGTSDIERVLRLGGIDFDVAKAPVRYRTEPGGPDWLAPDHYVTFRNDTGAPLGVVGSRYEILQNIEAFEFLQDLADSHNVTWESAGALHDGRRVFVCMRLPDTIHIDEAGISDEIAPFIVISNSHDGSSIVRIVVTPWRPVCGNTERFAVRDAVTSWGVRHTRNARERVVEARRSLQLSANYFDTFAREEQVLAEATIAITEFEELVATLWMPPATDASKRVRDRHETRQTVLRELWRANSEQVGQTAYAAERAITQYCDWHTGIRPRGSLRGRNLAARATAALDGRHDATKTRAHQHLLTMVRR